MLVSVRQQRARQQINCVYNVVCVCVCVPVCVVEFFHHYQCPCCHCCCGCCGWGCHMPLNANAARSTFACRLRLLWRHNCMPRPQSAPEREREWEEKRAHRAWPLYSSIFVCRISWHFSVRRQLLPVSVSVTLAPPFPPVRTLLCRRALFVLARVQDVPTFCCPWVSFAAGPCNTPAHRLPVLFSFCLPTFQLPILAIDMWANSWLQRSFSCCAVQVRWVCVWNSVWMSVC